jgi:hypothetical protein
VDNGELEKYMDMEFYKINFPDMKEILNNL